MWLLDRFSNPLWRRVARLRKPQRRTVATALCAYDFLRQQVDGKLIGALEAYLREHPDAVKTGGVGLTADLRTQLTEEALLALLWSCTCPAFDPGLKLPREVVVRLPEVWGSFVLADVNHRLNRSGPWALSETGYSEDPEEAHEQVLARWRETLGVTDSEFASRLNAAGFAEAWDWFAQMFIADTLDGMAIIPDRMLFSQARRLAGTIPPHREILVKRFIEEIDKSPDRYDALSK